MRRRIAQPPRRAGNVNLFTLVFGLSFAALLLMYTVQVILMTAGAGERATFLDYVRTMPAAFGRTLNIMSEQFSSVKEHQSSYWKDYADKAAERFFWGDASLVVEEAPIVMSIWEEEMEENQEVTWEMEGEELSEEPEDTRPVRPSRRTVRAGQTFGDEEDEGTSTTSTNTVTVDLPFIFFTHDINGDGKADHVGTPRKGGVIYWYENTGESLAGWPAHSISLSPVDRSLVAAGDIDNDFDLDLLVLNRDVGRLLWYEHVNSAPFFVERFIASAANDLTSPVLKDVDGDGDRDIQVSYGDGRTIWYENNGRKPPGWVGHVE